MADIVFTADQIEQGIEHALAEHRVDVIPGLLGMLARIDPDRAERIHATIRLALESRLQAKP